MSKDDGASVKVAMITAAAVILAAVITGLFGLVSQFLSRKTITELGSAPVAETPGGSPPEEPPSVAGPTS